MPRPADVAVQPAGPAGDAAAHGAPARVVRGRRCGRTEGARGGSRAVFRGAGRVSPSLSAAGWFTLWRVIQLNSPARPCRRRIGCNEHEAVALVAIPSTPCAYYRGRASRAHASRHRDLQQAVRHIQRMRQIPRAVREPDQHQAARERHPCYKATGYRNVGIGQPASGGDSKMPRVSGA